MFRSEACCITSLVPPACLLPPPPAVVVFDCTAVADEPELAVAAFDVEPKPDTEAKPAPWEVCESYGPAECAAHDDRCSLCTNARDGSKLCFRQAIAAKLPPCE